jgi:hypothetical protein
MFQFPLKTSNGHLPSCFEKCNPLDTFLGPNNEILGTCNVGTIWWMWDKFEFGFPNNSDQKFHYRMLFISDATQRQSPDAHTMAI